MVKKRKIAPKGGRPARREGERLSKNRTFRVRGALDDQLLKSATNSGRSVSEEIEHRLERSFSEDAAFGGGAVKHMAIRMAVAFDHAGRAAAAAAGHPDWTAEEWVLDENSYRTAVFGVISSLLKSYPGSDLTRVLQIADGIPLMVESLKGNVATVIVNEARRMQEQ